LELFPEYYPPFRCTTGTYSTPLAGKRQIEFMGAIRAAYSDTATLINSAVEIGPKRRLYHRA